MKLIRALTIIIEIVYVRSLRLFHYFNQIHLFNALNVHQLKHGKGKTKQNKKNYMGSTENQRK